MAVPQTETTSAAVNGIPPLVNGERLTRAEFERRYEAMPHIKKAELIEGVVYMPSPTRYHEHGRPHGIIAIWLGAYELATPGVEMANNTTVRVDDDNEPQPDGMLTVRPDHGGQLRIDADGYIEAGPDLAAEVAASTVSHDRNAKFRVYRSHGIREYLLWRILAKQVDWFVLRQGQYEPLMADASGILRSEVFPGLWLDTAALVRRNTATLMATLQQGLASPEHAAFVAQLQSAAGTVPTP